MSGPDRSAETFEQRRARLDRVFGEVLPDTTRDERSEEGGAGSRDDDLLRDVPPHHG